MTLVAVASKNVAESSRSDTQTDAEHFCEESGMLSLRWEPFPLGYSRIVLPRTTHRAPCVVCDGIVARSWLDVEEQLSRSRQLESVKTAALPVAATAGKG